MSRNSFRVDRSSNMPLAEQLYRSLRKAIVCGDYRSGECLPGIRDLAVAAGVSEKVSRNALARLAEIGWCESERGRRSVVADRGKDRLGRVLIFNAAAYFGFHSSRFIGALRALLLSSDYRLTAVSAYDLKSNGTSQILSETLKEHWDLVIEMGMRQGTRHAIENAGWPFVVLGDGGKCIPSVAANCVGAVELRNGLAVPEFVQACAKKRIRSVVQFLHDEGGFDVSGMMTMAEIKCKTVRLPRVKVPFDMYRKAYVAMTELLKQDSARPDVFLFTDDHLAHGGLLALMERGVRVPEDVKVVTHANRGLAPFCIKPLTRLEMDPVAQGREVAQAVLAYFRTGRFPKGIVLGSVWKQGETF